VTTDEFVRGIYNAISSSNKQQIEELKDKYQSYDLLLIDDIQFLANKEKANEIFFNIFNNNINNGQIVVMSSDKTPTQLGNFEDRIRSRFNSGLVIQINHPDINTMRNILETKIKEDASNFNFTKDAINYIVHRNSRDIRSLEGYLHRVLFYALNNLPPQAIIDTNIISKNLENDMQNKISQYGYDIDPDIVISQICEAYTINQEVVKSKIRTKQSTLVRHVCMYVLRNKFNMPYAQIGSYLGGRDHSTVLDGISKINKMVKKDHHLKEFIETLYKKM
jgi:chromosomal replication initiator protein